MFPMAAIIAKRVYLTTSAINQHFEYQYLLPNLYPERMFLLKVLLKPPNDLSKCVEAIGCAIPPPFVQD